MKRYLFLGATVFILAALAVPFLSAGFIKQALQRSIERALSRPVRIQGETHFRILPTPAILADDVIISEDPAFSLEPFAYVTVLEVQPSLTALFSGRLEPSRLRLTEPSVNLMHGPSGWNIQSLISGKLRPPEVEVRNGRLNFKQGNSKSAFYLTNALVDISAPSPQGDVKIFFSAEPARTDRGTQGFGNFSLRGELHAPSSGTPDLDFDIELQPSSIHAFNFFFGARGVDFAGKLSGKGRLKGPLDNASLEGSLQFEGLEPQSFLPFGGKSNQLSLKGKLDFHGQKVMIDTAGGDSLRVRMRARDLFTAPKGGLLVELRNIEFAKLLDLGREASAKLPAGIAAQGKFNGVIGYAWPSPEDVPAKGMIWFADARIDLPDQPSLQIASASAVVEGSRWRLAPAEIQVGESQSATMDAQWNSRDGALSLDVTTKQLSVNGLKTGLGLLVQASSLPLLSKAQGGSWQGNLKYDRSEDSDPGSWRGSLGVRNLSLDLDGLTGPFQISTAAILFDPQRIAIRRMRADWDGLDLEGEVTYSPNSPRQADLKLTIAETSISTLTRALQSAQRPPASLLEKMRLRRSSMPDWLRNRNVTGTIQFKTLYFAAGSFSPLNLQFTWRGAAFDSTITAAEFSLPNQPATSLVEGSLHTEFWQPTVSYTLDGAISNWPLEKSTANLQGQLKASSLDADWLDNLEGEATLTTTEPTPEPMKLVIHQGKLTLESGESRRKSQPLSAPYWPLTLPSEP